MRWWAILCTRYSAWASERPDPMPKGSSGPGRFQLLIFIINGNAPFGDALDDDAHGLAFEGCQTDGITDFDHGFVSNHAGPFGAVVQNLPDIIWFGGQCSFVFHGKARSNC